MSKLNKVFDLFVLLLQFFYSFNSFFSVFFSVLNHITILISFIYKLQPFVNTIRSIIYFLHALSRIEQPCQLRTERLLYNLLINKVLLLLVLPDYLKQVVLSATPKSVASKMTELTLDQYLFSFLPIVITVVMYGVVRPSIGTTGIHTQLIWFADVQMSQGQGIIPTSAFSITVTVK